MKAIRFFLIIIILAVISCKPGKEQENYFTSSDDTIVICPVKIKGFGMLPGGGGPITFRDTSEKRHFSIIFPEGIDNIKLGEELIDFKPFQFRRLKADKSEYMTTFLKDFYNSKIDTSNLPSARDNSISIMTGIRGNDTIFIVDENQNKDFRDDSVRLIDKLDWRSKAGLISCNYKIYNGKDLVNDTGWVMIGTFGSSDLLFIAAQHLEASFTFDDNNYQIEVLNSTPYVRFCFDSPLLAITAENNLKKDSLYEADMLKPNEFLKLKDFYYRFSDISNDGKTITLVRDNDFRSNSGTQTGMLAPGFNCKTMDGDSVRFPDYKGKYLLIANVSACWSEESSYQCYKDLTEAFKGKLEFLCLDKSPSILRTNIKELKLTGKFIDANENTTIASYRPDFCSRTCFLIDPSGRIVDKFEIFDWRPVLKRYFVTQ